MTYLLAKPDGWEIRFHDPKNRARCGRDKMRKIIKELIDAGYIDRKISRTSKNRFETTHRVYELPTLNPNYGKKK